MKKVRDGESQKREDAGARKGKTAAETSGQMRHEKLHTIVAQSTFLSNKWQNTVLDHFWKLRCRKSAHRCGAKHMWKSNVKIGHGRTTFGSCDVEQVHAIVARSTF